MAGVPAYMLSARPTTNVSCQIPTAPACFRTIASNFVHAGQ